jgi:uncharacterized protein YndB with AHSA1/START domain
VTRHVIGYTGTHQFRIPHDELWTAIGRTDRFATWWGWLEEFRADNRTGDGLTGDGRDGDGLQAGTVLRGVVAPPVPFRMRVSVEILRVKPPDEIEAAVHGDLEGTARLSVRSAGTGSTVEIEWEVEMMQRPMRIACRYGYPLMKWGHDRVVEMTLSSFRRHVETEWRNKILS